jgi:predicted transcriptional regulator
MKKILLWLIMGTRGGINRGKIIKKLHERPFNANKISNSLNLNYRTVTHHLNILEKNNIVNTIGDKYGKVYILSEEMEKEFSDFDEIWGQLEDIN